MAECDKCGHNAWSVEYPCRHGEDCPFSAAPELNGKPVVDDKAHSYTMNEIIHFYGNNSSSEALWRHKDEPIFKHLCEVEAQLSTANQEIVELKSKFDLLMEKLEQ